MIYFENPIKLARAKKELKDKGVVNPTEDEVKELYLKYGGLLTEDVATLDDEEEVEAPKKVVGAPKKVELKK